MSTTKIDVVSVLATLRNQGVEIALKSNGNIICDPPWPALTPDQQAMLKDNRQSLIELLVSAEQDVKFSEPAVWAGWNSEKSPN